MNDEILRAIEHLIYLQSPVELVPQFKPAVVTSGVLVISAAAAFQLVNVGDWKVVINGNKTILPGQTWEISAHYRNIITTELNVRFTENLNPEKASPIQRLEVVELHARGVHDNYVQKR